jgi:hypothetical protein
MAIMARSKPTPKIKFYEIINWLFTNSEIPDNFISQKTQLNSLVPYLTEQFWTLPKITWYLNKHTNDLFNIPDPIEQLQLLKKLIQYNNITKNELWSFIPERKKDLIKEIQERDNLDENDSRAKLILIEKNGRDISQYTKVAPTKRNIDLTNAENQERVRAALKHQRLIEEKKMQQETQSSNRYLTELNQDIIDELELVLFDVSLLKKTNRILYVFIDKNNEKKYYILPFAATIYISQRDGVINNDYIEERTDDFHQYIIKDIKLYTRLKFMLNDSYKRILNVY